MLLADKKADRTTDKQINQCYRKHKLLTKGVITLYIVYVHSQYRFMATHE